MSEPAWLIALVDQRLALLEQAVGGSAYKLALVVTPLTEPAEDSKIGLAHWERSCDNCGAFCPGKFFTGHLIRALRNKQQVCITFGVCPSCKATFG